MKINPATFSLESDYRDLLRRIAATNRRTMTEELRIMIDKRSVELDMKPIREPAKDSAPTADRT